MPSGYNGKLLWIDLAGSTFRWEVRTEDFFRCYIGGGLLATKLLFDHTPPGIDPLGPENLLIFSSSVLAGHPAAGLPRFTVAAKSPLTNGIGETRCEGPWGISLKSCGADAIVFEGAAPEPVVVMIDEDAVHLIPAGKLWGTTVGETVDCLESEFGADIHVAAIGPAGERQVRFASIITDRTYQAARMGMGAVMGAKQLKAVVLRKPACPQPANELALRLISNSFEQRIPTNDLSRWQKLPPGFSCWQYLHGLDAALCVNNYSCPSIEGIEAFKEEEFLRRHQGVAPCPGCPNDCIKYLHPLDNLQLDRRASGIHQEVTGTLGPNLGITDLDWVLAGNNFCNQYGLDPTSLGFTISFAMELKQKGIFPDENYAACFGDATAARRLMEAITFRRGIGDLLADGTRIAAQRIGRGAEYFAMHVKGQEMVCFEPRSQTNLALGYAVAPIGPRYDICEHDWDFDTEVGWEHTLHLSRTLGITERIGMGECSPRKVANFKALNTLWSAADALDLCIFAIAPTRILSMPEMAAMLAAVSGWETSDYEIMRIGERRNQLMRWYNVREGLRASDDTLPDRFFEEPISQGPRHGDVLNRAVFQQSISTYYSMMGWNDEGVPLPATLYDHRII